MKGIIIAIMICIAGLAACRNSTRTSDAGDLADSLKKEKVKTDHLVSDSSLVVYVKVKGKKDLVKVENKRYPRNIDTTYNVLRDKGGRIIYVAELPFNPSSEWFIAYKSYFDSLGHLYAFQKVNNFLNNGCTHGAAMETLVKYYSSSFKVIDSAYTLTDTYRKPLDKTGCKFPYNFPYQVFGTVAELKASRRIPAL